MTSVEFQNIATTLPHQPGIYKYYDSREELLYVGKAKNLRKRVGSYFTKTFTNYKTQELVHRIARVDFTIVITITGFLGNRIVTRSRIQGNGRYFSRIVESTDIISAEIKLKPGF